MDELQGSYNIKSLRPLEYYLGNDYKQDRKEQWAVECQKYLIECIKKIEAIVGVLKKETIPTSAEDHPELDNSPKLNDNSHKQ